MQVEPRLATVLQRRFDGRTSFLHYKIGISRDRGTVTRVPVDRWLRMLHGRAEGGGGGGGDSGEKDRDRGGRLDLTIQAGTHGFQVRVNGVLMGRPIPYPVVPGSLARRGPGDVRQIQLHYPDTTATQHDPQNTFTDIHVQVRRQSDCCMHVCLCEFMCLFLVDGDCGCGAASRCQDGEKEQDEDWGRRGWGRMAPTSIYSR